MIMRVRIGMIVRMTRIVESEFGELGSSDTVCRDFDEEDGVDSGHGESRCERVIPPSARKTF